MGSYLVVLLSLLIVGCGQISVDPKPIVVKPIEVNHNVKVDPALIAMYYRRVCETSLPNGSQSEVDSCVRTNVDDFLNALSLSNVPSTQTIPGTTYEP